MKLPRVSCRVSKFKLTRSSAIAGYVTKFKDSLLDFQSFFYQSFFKGKGLTGIPKIALRKSETKTLKKICGLGLNSNFLVGVYDF